MKNHNKNLAQAADKAGVKNYAVFQNYGYMGLYGGLKAKDIHAKKGLKKSQVFWIIWKRRISHKLTLLRTNQIERENIQGEKNANKAHHSVGKKVRKTIKELGGTMPEELPATDGISRAKAELKKKTLKN